MVGNSGYKYISKAFRSERNTIEYRFKFDGKTITKGYDLEYIVKYRNEWLCKKFKLVDDYTGGV